MEDAILDSSSIMKREIRLYANKHLKKDRVGTFYYVKCLSFTVKTKLEIL